MYCIHESDTLNDFILNYFQKKWPHSSSSRRCRSSCSFCIRARRRRSASSRDASSASMVPPTLRPVGVPGDSESVWGGQNATSSASCHRKPSVIFHQGLVLFTCTQFSAGRFRDLLVGAFTFAGLPVQGAVVTLVVAAGSGGPLPERGGRVLTRRAGRLGPTSARSHPGSKTTNGQYRHGNTQHPHTGLSVCVYTFLV